MSDALENHFSKMEKNRSILLKKVVYIMKMNQVPGHDCYVRLFSYKGFGILKTRINQRFDVGLCCDISKVGGTWYHKLWGPGFDWNA